MLAVPAYTQIDGIIVFRDDEDPSRFYYLPRQPKIITENGKPMLSFLYYEYPIERTRTEKGGGYLVFSTAMTEDPGILETRVLPRLQSMLRSELPDTAVMPEAKLAPVDFTSGEVKLLIMQNDEFVKSIHLGRPSLMGDNTASVAVELPEYGAELFRQALIGGSSIGAIEYDLRFPVRLPAITIQGHINSREVKTALMTYTREKVEDSDVWGGDDRWAAHRTSISETMEAQGLIQLEILKGSVELSSEDMESLRAFAFRAMDEFIKEHFLQGGTVESGADRENQRMEFLGQDVTTNFDLNVSYRDVIYRDYSPSAQINPSFLGVPAEEVITEINLGNAPWYYKRLEVDIDTSMDFETYDDIVHSVVGHLSYDQTQPDGTRLTKRESVRFTKDDTTKKTFKTHLAEVGKDTYHVDVEVNYKSGPVQQAIVDSFDTTTRNLTLNIPNPGVVEVEFSAAPEAFEGQLESVEVEVEYGDPRRDIPTVVGSVLLNETTPKVSYRRVIYAPWDRPFRYRLTYVLLGADSFRQRSTIDWIEASHETPYVKVSSPFDQSFDLSILPQVDFSEVRELVVDLDYHDEESDYRVRKTLSFSDVSKTRQQWTFLLRDPDHRAFRYRKILLFKNSSLQEGDWQPRDVDGTLVVGNAPHGLLTMEVDPVLLDIPAEVKLAVVQLKYASSLGPEPDTALLRFRDTTAQTWIVTLGPSNERTFTYDVTYVMQDNSRRLLPSQVADIGEYLQVPPPPAS